VVSICDSSFPYELWVRGGKGSCGRVQDEWSDDGQTVLFRGNLAAMDLWKKFVLDLVEEVERMLARDLMFAREGKLPYVNLWDIEDEQCREEVGYNFGSYGEDGMSGSCREEDMIMPLILVG
jgi:hypothetical protein